MIKPRTRRSGVMRRRKPVAGPTQEWYRKLNPVRLEMTSLFSDHDRHYNSPLHKSNYAL